MTLVVQVTNVLNVMYMYVAETKQSILMRDAWSFYPLLYGQSLFTGLDHWTGILDSPLTQNTNLNGFFQ